MDSLRPARGFRRACRHAGPAQDRLLPTLAVGLVGALLGGLIGNVLLGHKVHFGWDLGPFLLAVSGAIVLLLALEALAGRRGGRRLF